MIILNRILLNPLLLQPPPPSMSISAVASPSLYYRRNRVSVKLGRSGGDVFLCRRKCSCSRIRVYSEFKTEEKQVRKYSPLLDSRLLLENNVSTAEFKTIPDIWRSTAEKFGDRIALVDPHHDPPTNMTYKQVEQDILDFSEGLRVIGIKPTEKIALFADNSCRWLIADQGIMATGAINVVRGSRSSVEELLHIYEHSESVAIVVDNPELYHRIADSFKSKASVRFVILLWGEKSSISSHTMEEIPAYSYKEIIDTYLICSSVYYMVMTCIVLTTAVQCSIVAKMRVTFPRFGSLAGSFNTRWHKRSILFDYRLLITGVVTWKECLGEAVAWDTFTWFASLIAITGYLNKYGLISWLSQIVVKDC